MQPAILGDEANPDVAGGVVNCIAYGEGRRAANLRLDQLSAHLEHHPNDFVWIGLYEPAADVLSVIQSEFRLHELAVEDAYRAHQRPKLEQYGETLFVVLRTAHLGAGAPLTVEFGETHVFLGPKFVVSVRHGSIRSHVDVRARCEASPLLLAKGPGYVLYSLLDFVVDQYLPVVEGLDEALEEVEEQVFSDRFSRDTARCIYQLKRDLLGLKRATSPLIDVCNRLVRFDNPLIPEDTRPYFRDVYDHVIRINERIDTTRELLTTALEANLAFISVAQNADTRRLAAWAAIIAVPTMVAGIYGMNFTYMPELQWAWGYPASLGVMALACGALFAGFKRSGWL